MEQQMEKQIDSRRIIIFLAFAFGIAWITGLVIYLTGGLTNSPQIVPGISLALVLLATAYMWAPALGNILTRLITREGWKECGPAPAFQKRLALLAGRLVPAGGDDAAWSGPVFCDFSAVFRCEPVRMYGN